MTGQGDVLLPAEMRSVRASSITSNKSSKRRKNNRKKKAKEWTYYIETLKSSIDCLYEICRADQSIIGCKEALMYIQNADKDFHSLIEAINLEKNFSKEEPQAVAWEIRKTMNSPTHNFHEKSAQKLMEALPISPIVINELSLVNSLVKEENEVKEIDPDDGWQVVSRTRRRKSNSSSLAESLGDRRENDLQEEENTRQRPPSVYERLSSGISCRKHGVDSPTRIREMTGRPVSRGSTGAGGKLTCPRSAMDLPQTKASMAKISYCRQRLWEKDVKPKLAEKLAGQKRERVQRPSVPSVCQINFSDPSAVRKRALEYSENLKQQRKKTIVDSRSLQSLQAINENGELDGDLVPADPKPSDPVDITTRSEPPRELSSPLDLDVEWREMTEEEQSLAMEEQSLNLEIEKAESELESMDAELLRQVDEEAEGFPLPEETQDPMAARIEMFRKMEDEFKNFLQISWSDLMEKEFSGHIHEPGMVAERHEKMSSPTRRRCEKDDDDFSKRHAEKIRRADEAREKLQQERRQKLHELAQRRDEVRAKQAALIEKKRLFSEKRMERAQENRDKNITEIVKKAKSDEQRVAEIQFINTMQDDNMRFMMQSKEQHVEERKQILVEERAKKIEEKAMKEQAVEERRKAAEQKRLQRIQENEEKRAKQTQLALEKKKSVKQKKEEKEKELTENPNLLPLPSNYFPLDAMVTRQNWPSSQSLDEPITCTKCNETMSTNLDCFVHILSEDHLAKADITAVNATPKRLEEELNSLKIDRRPLIETRPMSSAQSERDRSISRIDLQSYNFKRGNDQFRSLFKEPTCSKSQETDALHAQLLVGTITDPLVDALNSSLKFLLKGNVSENALSFLPLVEPLLKMIVSLDDKTPLPTLIKLCTIVEKASTSIHFALKCLFSTSVLQLFDGLNRYSKESPCSPYFSAIMDVCLSLLQPVNSKKDLEAVGMSEEVVDDRVALIYELIAEFGENIPNLIGRGDSAAKWTRIHNFASYFLAKVTDEKSLSIVYIDIILRETYEAFRLSTGSDIVDKPNRCDSEITSKLANRMMHILERLQHTRKPILWASLFANPTRNFRFCLICTELMRRCIVMMKRDSTGLELVPQLLFLLRYFVSKSPSHQILCMLGDEKSTIGIICQLPNEFFNQAVIATQSIPTLILMTHGSIHCRQELLTKRICIFIGNFIKNAPYNEHSRMCLKPVLAEELWRDAVKFYHF